MPAVAASVHDTITVLHVGEGSDFGPLTGSSLEHAETRFEVITAESGEEGHEIVATGSIDCVVCEYSLPGMDGVGFLEALRDEYPMLPVLLIIPDGGAGIASEAIDTGVTDYIQADTVAEDSTHLANRNYHGRATSSNPAWTHG
jgi:DNA-binding NtrC family response regulator